MYNRGSKRSAKRTTTAKTKHRHQVIEALESRQLLTTLYGGGPGLAAIYRYATDGASVPNAQITIYGDVIAEFIFMHGTPQGVLSPQGGVIVNRDVAITYNPNPSLPPGSVKATGTLGLNVFPDSPTTPTGSDIFAIYVSKSDINSYISISSIDPTTGALTTFAAAQSFNIIAANPKPTTAITAPAGGGSLVLGAQTGGTFNAPIIKTDINGSAFGVRPAGLDDLPEDPNNDLSAGLRVANGQDLGKFLFDGEVYGKVRVDGSMNLFYAGWLLTGDARGADEGEVGASGLPVSLVDTFVTAEDTALGSSRHIVPRQNFYIGGDLQNLVSVGPIGWDATFGTASPDTAPFFLSGVDIYVRGRIGQIQASGGNTATVTALNMDPAVAGFVRPVVYQEELEGWWHFPNSGVVNLPNGFPNTPSMYFDGGVLRRGNTGRDAVPIQTDTFDSFQMLAPFNSPNGTNIIDLLGSIYPNAGDGDNDPVDYFGIALLAGQKVRLVVRSSGGNAHLGVFDPDGRLIASDYSNVATPIAGAGATSLYTYEIPIEFTADRPGIYRIAVGERGDADFNGSPNTLSPEFYELLVTNVGSVAIGGIMVAQQSSGPLADATPTRMLDVAPGTHQVIANSGDFGGLWGGQYNTASSRIFVPTTPPPPNFFNQNITFGSMYVPAGNLRALDVTILGVGTPSAQTIGVGIDLNVAGDVGLVQTRDAGGIMELNPSIQAAYGSSFTGGSVGGSSSASFPTASANPTTPVPFTPATLSIGGNYQVINALSRFTGGVYAKKGMGILRTAAISGANPTDIFLDTDSTGFDGKSDLIDVSGSIDGPILRHGPGGNFRYMRVGGTVNVDSQFGLSDLGYVPYNYGQSVTFTDDSGSTISLTPVGQRVANPAYDPLDPSKGPQFLYPQLSTLTYPVRSGGVIVMDVQSTGSLSVNTQAGSFNGTAEISRIEVHGAGTAPVVATRFTKNGYQTTITQPFTTQAQGNALSVTIGGSATTDVAYIVGLAAEPGNSFYTSPNTTIFLGNIVPQFRSSVSEFSNLTLVSNTTGGEILSLNALNVGDLLSTGPIGVTRTTSIDGNSLNFIAPIAIGTGYGARPTDSSGDAPVNPTGTVVGSAFPFNQQTYGIAVGGNIANVRSNTALGNIIATGIIGTVVANADGKNKAGVFEGINGPIFAFSGTSAPNPSASSGVPNGSILSVNIGEGMGSAGSGDFARTGIFAGNQIGSIVGNNADIRGTITFGQSIGSINLTNGSLIDANVLQLFTSVIAGARESSGLNTSIGITNAGVVPSIGAINIKGNGGILGTVISATNIGPINVAGFGILSSEIVTAFASTGISGITVGGYGIRDTIISTGNNIPSVTVTGNGKNLPTYNVTSSIRQSEFALIDPVLGVAFDPYSGRALVPLNDIHASLGTSQSSPVVRGVTDTGVIENTQISSQRAIGRITAQTIRGDLDATTGRPLTRFSAGNSIETIQTRGLINGLQVITGRLKNFLPASNVGNLYLTISGPLDNLTIKGNLDKGSVIEAIGPNGRIGNVSIKKNLNGTIHAVQTIGNVTIGGNLNGLLKVDAFSRNRLALNKLQVGGTIANGGLDVGAPNRIANVGQIIVGKSLGNSSSDVVHITGTVDRIQVGGKLVATVNVGRGIGTLQTGRVAGSIRTGGTLKNLIVKRGGLHGDLTVAGVLQNASIKGGIFSNVTANNGIGNVTVNGSVAPDTTIRTNFGTIGTLRVSGDLDGSVISSGKIGQIIVGRDIGNGTTPLTISAPRLDLLQVGGSIKNGATVDINGPIGALIVGGDIDEGAVIEASAVNRHQFNGEVFGSLLIG